MKRPDPEVVETLSDAEQLYQVSYTDRRSTIVVTDRPYQETVENASAGLPEPIAISSTLEIVPPPEDAELLEDSNISWNQTAASINSMYDFTELSSSPSTKKSKKKGKADR